MTRDNITPNNIPSLIPIKRVTNKVIFKIIKSLKLNESNFFFEEMQRLGNIGSYYVNITTGTWIISSVLKNIFGIKQESTLDFDSWFSQIHPDYKREIKLYVLEKISDNYPKFLLTTDTFTQSRSGIRHLNVFNWLLA
jgi:hypothetical protein